MIGPQIPSFLSRKSEDDINSSDTEESETSKIIGPVLPSSLSSPNAQEDSEIFGPMPPQTNVDYDLVNIIEKRASNMKNRLENKVC